MLFECCLKIPLKSGILNKIARPRPKDDESEFKQILNSLLKIFPNADRKFAKGSCHRIFKNFEHSCSGSFRKM